MEWKYKYPICNKISMIDETGLLFSLLRYFRDSWWIEFLFNDCKIDILKENYVDITFCRLSGLHKCEHGKIIGAFS